MTHDEVAQHIKDCVRREGSCTPGEPKLIDADTICPVWRVRPVAWDATWKVHRPAFWYVCPEPALNLYRNDLFRPPRPAGESDEAYEAKIVDHVKSFHVGLIFRMQARDGRTSEKSIVRPS